MRRTGRRRPALLALCALLTCVTACGASLPAASPVPPSPGTSRQAGTGSTPEETAPAVAVDAAGFARGRARALETGDEDGWLAPVGQAPEAVRARQERAYALLRRLGVADVEVEAVEPPRLRPDGGAQQVRVTLRHRLAIADRATSVDRLVWTLRPGARPQEPPVLLDDGGAARAWEHDGAGVTLGRRSVVVGSAPAPRRAEVAARADEALARVEDVWGAAPPRVLLLAPATAQQARVVAGGGLREGVLALTIGERPAGRGAGADRVVLDPAGWERATRAGRDALLAHEITHVAVRAATGRDGPRWLEEGFAQYVAYRSLSVPVPELAAALARRVDRAGVPVRLPSDEQFETSGERLAVAYDGAWLAALHLAQTRGEAALVRAVQAGGLGAIGLDEAVFTRAWRTRVAQLRRPGGSS